jgi:very-short-patch-repair endonuclease
MAGARQRLVDLLDYIEQVVRLDERVALRVSEYRLQDGSTFAISKSDTSDLPSVRHNIRDGEGPVWLEVERLARREPPVPPKETADWIVLSPDPSQVPDIRTHRIVTVSAAQRDAALEKRQVRPGDVLPSPRKSGEAANAPLKFDLKLRLEDRPALKSAIEKWVAGEWSMWSVEEITRRRTIALYQQLYKLFQLLEIGSSESSIEVIWGIGVVKWEKGGAIVDRPLLERRVDIELDEMRGGLIRVRPTSADATFDLKPYEEFGCPNLGILSDLIRREIQRSGDDEGISPFSRDTYETILSVGATRLDPDGCYFPDLSNSIERDTAASSRLAVMDNWILFARPRSQHVVLQDIERLRNAAEQETTDIGGLPQHLVTTPSRAAGPNEWEPLNTRLGQSVGEGGTPGDAAHPAIYDVFFPKPFNDDQLAILRMLSAADGFVVQGPPGTGKTHTIANLICHYMAIGKRVLVVSHGEAALAVLKDQLPREVQPLAIAVLSNERQGLRQIEKAIRQIQSVVEETRPESRRSVIARIESEIKGLQQQIKSIDDELDRIAEAHLTKIGPRGETPSALAQRLVSERPAYTWFTDRPTRSSSETKISDREIGQLAEARRNIGDLIDHLSVQLPAPSDLPDAESVAQWHADLMTAAEQQRAAIAGPAKTLRITSANVESAFALAKTLEGIGLIQQASEKTRWLEALWRASLHGEPNPLCDRLRERMDEAEKLSAERAALLSHSTEFPGRLLDDQEALLAISRAARGEKLWPILKFGRGDARALVSAIKVDGAAVPDGNTKMWAHVAAAVSNALRQRGADSRWDAFIAEVGGTQVGQNRKATIEICQRILKVCDEAHRNTALLASIVVNQFSFERLATDQKLCLDLAKQIRALAVSVRLSAAEHHRRRVHNLFQSSDRTSVSIRRLFEEAVGNPRVRATKLSQIWIAMLSQLQRLKNLAVYFDTVLAVTSLIDSEGAPAWASRLREERATSSLDFLIPAAWRDVWDYAAAESLLSRIDERDRLAKLTNDRESADRQCRKLFGELVRERTFYELNRRLTPGIKTALVEFVRALTRIGAGTGKSAWIHRRAAREAMSRCYDAVPCWIMPTWRVAEQLPAELGALDLVIIDEASQSDVTELPALLRGKKILVVGDDRQVSPTAPFVTQEKIEQLRHHYLGELPFKTLLEPGESIYDLMRAVFPSHRLMLKEHFRCVEPIIRFSMQFYPEKLLPLRTPNAHERLDPPLVDIYVPHGVRSKRKTNEAEAEVIVREVAALTANPTMRERTIGVISLIGAEQAELVRAKLSEAIGEELMQRHAILCGDSATFQGSERDIVFLSMVADPANKKALTMLRYEQRFNVAVSRARDRLVLVRSVNREELNPNDLKAKLIAHFENPMPEVDAQSPDGLVACESVFERDLMSKLLDRGYRVQPQVGSLGYRIDMVVEGLNGARLAVECDGDRYHGPEQWRQDMRRQRTLERVGWRFWRCFASSFYRDQDAVIAELVERLSRMGIEPLKQDASVASMRQHVEHRVEQLSPGKHRMTSVASAERDMTLGNGRNGICVGDRIIVRYSDDSRRISVRLTENANDLEKGCLSVASPLGAAVLGAEEGDEIVVRLDDGQYRKALIEEVESTHSSADMRTN